jgi:hypothetical protein
VALKAAERDWDVEVASDLAERRWFALLSAIRTMQAECAVLLEASNLAGVAWRRSCTQLAEFEALRDALEEQMKQPQPLKYEPKCEFLGAGIYSTAATSARSTETAGP